MNVEIRQFTEKDIAECGKIFFQIFGPDGCGETWTLESSTQAVRENSFNTEYCFVAVDEEKIVGLVLAFPTIRETGNDVFIDTIGVISSHQGDHIGTKLYESVVSVAQKNGLQHIRLLANRTFLSYQWYKKMDMTESGWVELVKPLHSSSQTKQ